jgi:4-hydroxy-3-methylbut-2-enyl diphosphate reductase IspH
MVYKPTWSSFLGSAALAISPSITVHLQRVEVDDYHIALVGPFNHGEIRWSEAMGAVLKERENIMTRTDRLLIVRGLNELLFINISTFSEKDEEKLLDVVRRRMPVVVERSKPSI